ncbi:MAG: flavin reductase family protein [Alphaproteobacteria bacterium]|nr:flavin reductase family protein [Alphaproteobacteria bacterium]
MSIKEDQFRKTLGLFPTGVTVVTVPYGQEGDIGITISSFTSVSLHPAQILFCLAKRSKTIPAFKASRYFAVNILKASQTHISEGFAKHIPIGWEKTKVHRHAETGCLLFSEALGHVICEKSAMYDGGDHEIILGKVIDLSSNPNELPLIRHRGQYLTTPLNPLKIPLTGT